jgi:NitT/TauT family transport system ATP-binding protein
MIYIKSLWKDYHTDKDTIPVIADLDLTITKGEIISIIGPSGCGKTTLLRLVAQLIKPTNGTITIDCKKASVVFQNPVLLPWRTVTENINLPIELAGGRNCAAVSEMCDLVGLNAFGENFPSELSGGMKQRAALARALISKPDLLLMDEPFGALDEITRNRLNCELLRMWKEFNLTIILVTHSINEAVFLSNKVVVLSDRPARVKDVVRIKFRKQRNYALRETSEFQRYVRCIRKKIQ